MGIPASQPNVHFLCPKSGFSTTETYLSIVVPLPVSDRFFPLQSDRPEGVPRRRHIKKLGLFYSKKGLFLVLFVRGLWLTCFFSSWLTAFLKVESNPQGHKADVWSESHSFYIIVFFLQNAYLWRRSGSKSGNQMDVNRHWLLDLEVWIWRLGKSVLLNRMWIDIQEYSRKMIVLGPKFDLTVFPIVVYPLENTISRSRPMCFLLASPSEVAIVKIRIHTGQYFFYF